jgi:tetratricopeptide (TPR) repeat protein
MRQLELPSAPQELRGPVKAWTEPVSIPTFLPLAPDRNPMFIEKRVYQGSSGRVYPLPFCDRVADVACDRQWTAVHLENEFIRVMILPELGGRIHLARDKTNNYDFVYRQDVIKPALVGLAGPWISGGIEFNWPQHHRPSTFMPVDFAIENEPGGGCVVWLSEHEPMNRMKGMHGVRLRPGSAVLDLQVRLYNRTPLTQTFLWWANVATAVHEQYQSFFPTDVGYVADHAKRAISAFPLCQGSYYGVDYGKRAREGAPQDELPTNFAPPGTYPANDLSWYANIPVPTSYMCLGTKGDFFGGYDHRAAAGIVHVANHHIAPGKKQWTWGNHAFGYAWDRNLTEPDEQGVYRPYIELMAGAYTDNQPDFSFLAPGETKEFHQYWYPIREIGAAQQANLAAALHISLDAGAIRLGVAVPTPLVDAVIILEAGGCDLGRWKRSLRPETPFIATLALPAGVASADLRLRILDAGGNEVIAYRPEPPDAQAPEAATEPPPPAEIASADELYVTGLHIEQYRHATWAPDDYWREALRRDPLDCRCNNALGLRSLRRGEFAQAETYFRRALQRLTRRNPNPYDGEALYNLGLSLRYLERDDEAYAAFYKATWNAAWSGPGYHALAEIDCARGDWTNALDHLEMSLRRGSDNLSARNLKAIVLRRLGREDAASTLLRETLALDPLDDWARYLHGDDATGGGQNRLDLALDFARAGLYREAFQALEGAIGEPLSGAAPLIPYYMAYFARRMGDEATAGTLGEQARAANPDYCFPARLEEIAILREAIAATPGDPKAPYYLGNLLYDRQRYDEAIACWRMSAALDPMFSIVWRNLGIGAFNVRKDPLEAADCYERAFAAAPGDARLLYERDQLWRRLGRLPGDRLAELRNHRHLVDQRDDLTVEFCALLNQVGAHDEALEVLTCRRFQPWEGGEGMALGQYVRTRLALGRRALAAGGAPEARQHFEAALDAPQTLGEAKHLLANQSDVLYWLGQACSAAKDETAAKRCWTRAAEFRGDFQGMQVRVFSEMTYYSTLALRRLERQEEAAATIEGLRAYAETLPVTPAKIDYFATSLPTMLLFEQDLQQSQERGARFMLAQVSLASGDAARGRHLLETVLREDPNHAAAADLMREIERRG